MGTEDAVQALAAVRERVVGARGDGPRQGEIVGEVRDGNGAVGRVEGPLQAFPVGADVGDERVAVRGGPAPRRDADGALVPWQVIAGAPEGDEAQGRQFDAEGRGNHRRVDLALLQGLCAMVVAAARHGLVRIAPKPHSLQNLVRHEGEAGVGIVDAEYPAGEIAGRLDAGARHQLNGAGIVPHEREEVGAALFHRVDDVIQRQGAQVLGSGHQGGATHAGAARIGDLEVEPVACEDALLQAQRDRQIVGGTKVHDVQMSRSASGHGASLQERGVRLRGDGRWSGIAPDCEESLRGWLPALGHALSIIPYPAMHMGRDGTLNTVVGRAVVELVDVSKEYATADGMLRAMDRVSLEIGEGEFVAVLGPSGCGKSTLMLIAAGLVAPTSGTVRVAGVEVRAPYRDVGIVFQDATLYEWRRALENVLLPAQIQRLDPRRSRQRALELLELVGLQGFERKYPCELS